MPRRAGAGPRASSPGSRSGRREPIHASSWPIFRVAALSTCTKGSIARAGQADNHIKAWKNRLAADRTSCHQAEANQFGRFLHAGADWLLWPMRRLMPKRSIWRVMPFDTLRLRPIKRAARVIERKTQIKIHLPSRAPDQAVFAALRDRLPRLVT